MSYDIRVRFRGKGAETSIKGSEIVIEALSLSWGMSLNIGVGKGPAGKSSFQDVHFTKFYDSSSPTLYFALTNGTPFAQVVIELAKSGGGEKIGTFTLDEAFLTSVEATADGSVVPVEDVALSFLGIHWEAYTKDSNSKISPVTTGWNLAKNKAA